MKVLEWMWNSNEDPAIARNAFQNSGNTLGYLDVWKAVEWPVTSCRKSVDIMQRYWESDLHSSCSMYFPTFLESLSSRPFPKAIWIVCSTNRWTCKAKESSWLNPRLKKHSAISNQVLKASIWKIGIALSTFYYYQNVFQNWEALMF